MGIGFAVLQRHDCPRRLTTLVGVVGEAHRHQQTSEVGKAETQRAVVVAVLRYLLSRITREIHERLHRRNKHSSSLTKSRYIEGLTVPELFQIEGCEIAGEIVKHHKF